MATRPVRDAVEAKPLRTILAELMPTDETYTSSLLRAFDNDNLPEVVRLLEEERDSLDKTLRTQTARVCDKSASILAPQIRLVRQFVEAIRLASAESKIASKKRRAVTIREPVSTPIITQQEATEIFNFDRPDPSLPVIKTLDEIQARFNQPVKLSLAEVRQFLPALSPETSELNEAIINLLALKRTKDAVVLLNKLKPRVKKQEKLGAHQRTREEISLLERRAELLEILRKKIMNFGISSIIG